MKKRGQCSKTFDFVKITKPTAILIVLVVVLAYASDLAQVPSVSPTPTIPSALNIGSQIDQAKPISLQEAGDRARRQVSAVTTANLNAQIAGEDVRQARSAFFPK